MTQAKMYVPNKPNAPEQSQVIGESQKLSVSGDWERSWPSNKRRKLDDNSHGVLVSGDLTMMKPDFSKMTRQELRAYVLAHREDDAAIETFIKTGNPDSPIYPFPQTDEDLREMEEILKRKLG